MFITSPTFLRTILVMIVLLAGTVSAQFLVPVQTLTDGEGGVASLQGAAEIALSPDGRHAYVAASNSNALVVLSRDDDSGTLTSIQVLLDGENGVDGLNRANSVGVSPDGNHVYVASTGDNAVSVFSRDSESGQLR